MKRTKRLATFSILMILITLSLNSSTYAQAIADVGISAEYIPSNFTAYSVSPVTGTAANGIFRLLIQKSGSTIPANNFTVIVALATGVSYTGASFTVPPGFTFIEISPTSLAFKQTADYTGSGIPAIKTIEIPVQATAPILPGVVSNWSVQIQKDDVGYTDNQSGNDDTESRVTVNSSPLPVTLFNFSAVRENTNTNLSWSTTDESNSDRFEVEHSVNAKNWNLIGTVKSKGESKILEKYTFTHTEAVEGENLYRLKMIDRDDSFAYSRMISITFDSGMGAQIYPNPAADYLSIKSVDWNSVSELRIFNLNGQKIFKSSGKTISSQIDLRKMDPGVYMLEIQKNNGQKEVKKFVVVR
jgi:hypothetical protein